MAWWHIFRNDTSIDGRGFFDLAKAQAVALPLTVSSDDIVIRDNNSGDYVRWDREINDWVAGNEPFGGSTQPG